MANSAPQRKTPLIEIPKLGQNGTAPETTIRRIAKSVYDRCLRPGTENRLWISAPQPPGANFKVLGLRQLSLIVPQGVLVPHQDALCLAKDRFPQPVLSLFQGSLLIL